MPKYVKVQGTWKAVDESADCGKVKVNGVWRTVSTSYVKVANVWKAVCAPVPVSTTTTTTTPVTTTTTTVPVTTTTTTTVPVTTTTTVQAYPNISSVTAYGAGAGQVWTQTQAYITWSGSGWGSYTVIASNGSSSNSPSSAGGPPVLLSGFSANTAYSVTVTLFANANYSGQTASATGYFSTAAATTSSTTTTTTTAIANCGIMPSVIGLTESAASDAIVARGIAYEFTEYTTVGATAQNNGYVQSQSPGAGTYVGSCNFSYNATLVLYSYTAPTTTTTSADPCLTCNSYSPSDGSYTYTKTVPTSTCPSGSIYYRICVTPNGCANIDQTSSCVPVTTSSTTTTTTTAVVNAGTVYLSYCYNNAPVVESYPVNADNILVTDINQACSVYTTLLTNIGATSIDCSTVSARTAPTGCAATSTTTTTTAAVTYPALLSGFHLCTAGDAPNPSSPCPSNGSGTGVNCVENGASGASCPNPTATTTTAATTTTTAATTATTTSTAAVDCNTCNSYNPSNGAYTLTKADASCPDTGSRYYRVCITPGACPNIEQNGSCVAPATTSTAATTTAATTTTAASTTTTTSSAPCISRFRCKSYDVTNSASSNYYDCYTVNACTAPNNADGSRASCCA